jgi:hypothetical protein
LSSHRRFFFSAWAQVRHDLSQSGEQASSRSPISPQSGDRGEMSAPPPGSDGSKSRSWRRLCSRCQGFRSTGDSVCGQIPCDEKFGRGERRRGFRVIWLLIAAS